MYCALNIRAWFFTVSCRRPVLTQTVPVSIVCGASAKSGARIDLRQETKAYSRLERFFCTAFQRPAFMAGLLGASSDAPVSFVAGKVNPSNQATNEKGIDLPSGGSTNKGVIDMTHILSPYRVMGRVEVIYSFALNIPFYQSSTNTFLPSFKSAPSGKKGGEA